MMLGEHSTHSKLASLLCKTETWLHGCAQHGTHRAPQQPVTPGPAPVLAQPRWLRCLSAFPVLSVPEPQPASVPTWQLRGTADHLGAGPVAGDHAFLSVCPSIPFFQYKLVLSTCAPHCPGHRGPSHNKIKPSSSWALCSMRRKQMRGLPPTPPSPPNIFYTRRWEDIQEERSQEGDRSGYTSRGLTEEARAVSPLATVLCVWTSLSISVTPLTTSGFEESCAA